MKQTINPRLEVNRGPVLWAAATTVLCGILVLFVIQRPGWLLPAALVAGGIAGARSGFYDQSATNGLVGVLTGVLSLFPIVLFYRTVVVPTASNTGDVIFVGIVLSAVDIIVYGPLMLVFGYLGATVTDIVRRRTDGRLGY